MKQHKSIQKILTSNQKTFQIGLAMLGCLIGFFLILISVQSIINFQYVFEESNQGIGSQYMVINKKVGLLNTFNIGKTTFSEEEIKSISEHPSVKKLSSFQGNEFEAEAYLELNNESNKARLKTDLFLESVQDEFIDVDLKKWKWNSSSDEIPIILPTDFINLYNFTYAPSRNLPQISKNTVKLFGFSIIIRGNNIEKTYKGNIIGFSDRISSMLVPISFMKFANQKYGLLKLKSDKSSYRIITAVKPEQLNIFESFLSENNYETNQELIRNGKFIGLMYLLISIIFFIGLIITINAFTGFVLYFHLLIYRSRNEIDSLLRLGYPHIMLIKNYLSRIVIIIGCLFSIAVLFLIVTQHYVAGLLTKYNVDITSHIHYYSVISLLSVVISLIILFIIQISSEIYQIALPPKS